MSNISLYQAADALAPLLDTIDDDGCIPPELAVALAQFEGKGLSVIAYVMNCEASAAMIHEAAMTMDKRAEPLEKRAERLRQYLAYNMKRTGITEITCPEFSAKLAIGRDVSVTIENESQIPVEFMRTPEPKPPVAAPDKKLIGAALKEGKDVPGAVLMKKDRLTIK
jgi:hypothetical protein